MAGTMALAGHYQVTTAVNGRDALLKVAQLKPAAVLLDLSMPEMDGDEVLARMHADPQLARIPVIIVSSEKQRAEECLKTAATKVLERYLRLLHVLDRLQKDDCIERLAVLERLHATLDGLQTCLDDEQQRPHPLALALMISAVLLTKGHVKANLPPVL